MDGATRIWLDDPNPIFRMGLAASLRDPRFVVVGESAGFVPPPALEDIDVLVFDLGDERRPGWALSRRRAAQHPARRARPGGRHRGGGAVAVHRSRPFGADARGLPRLPRLGGGGSVGAGRLGRAAWIGGGQRPCRVGPGRPGRSRRAGPQNGAAEGRAVRRRGCPGDRRLRSYGPGRRSGSLDIDGEPDRRNGAGAVDRGCRMTGGPRVLVAGLPRSGTTWVGEVLGRTGRRPVPPRARQPPRAARRLVGQARLGPLPRTAPRRSGRRLRAAVGPGLRRRASPITALRRGQDPPAGRGSPGRVGGWPAGDAPGRRPARWW